MFNETKYTRWYFAIIERAKVRSPEGYTERHHIIPSCMGGTDVVRLTAREHFVCHLLLTKMVMTKRHQHQMNSAFWSMCIGQRLGRHKPNSSQYELGRKLHASSMSERLQGVNKSAVTRSKMSAAASARTDRGGTRNSMHTGSYITPRGEFDTLLEAGKAFGVTSASIMHWCKSRNDVPWIGRRTIHKDWIGKTPAEVGFSFREK